jgi:hypothetical protein
MSFPVQVAYGNFAGVHPAEESVGDQGVIWMLTMYPKNVAENIPSHILRQIRKEIENG